MEPSWGCVSTIDLMGLGDSAAGNLEPWGLVVQLTCPEANANAQPLERQLEATPQPKIVAAFKQSCVELTKKIRDREIFLATKTINGSLGESLFPNDQEFEVLNQ